MAIVLKNIIDSRKCEKVNFLKAIATIGTLFLILVPGIGLSESTATNSKSLFSEAQANFETGLKKSGEQRRILMIKAAGQFKSLIEDQQIENGYLYFNMGNAYYEAGEIGKSILAYRRAERFLPGFRDLQYNLEQARNRINGESAEESWLEQIINGLVFWHTMMSYNLRRNLFFTAFALVWILLGAMVFKRHVFLRMGLILAVALNVGFGGSYLVSYYKFNIVEAGVITANDATTRKGPGVGYETFYQKPLLGGTEFIIVESHDEWLKVRLASGDEMWIRAGDTGKI